MAGVLYLFRLFVYHREKGFASRDNHELLKVMEWRLFRYITVPAMIITWLAGLAMVLINTGLIASKWLHAKFFFVLLLTYTTLYAKKLMKRLSELDPNSPSGRSFRILNEVPTLLMLIIVGLVIFKPF